MPGDCCWLPVPACWLLLLHLDKQSSQPLLILIPFAREALLLYHSQAQVHSTREMFIQLSFQMDREVLLLLQTSEHALAHQAAHLQ